MLRLALQDFMRRTMVGFAFLVSICTVGSALAGDKIDVPKVITKSDAEKILGLPVKDANGRNQNGKRQLCRNLPTSSTLRKALPCNGLTSSSVHHQ
jgi:hypothetical protein